jgi:hypothetical protein
MYDGCGATRAIHKPIGVQTTCIAYQPERLHRFPSICHLAYSFGNAPDSQAHSLKPSAELFFANNSDGCSILVCRLASMPNAARSTAAQRLYGQPQFVSGFDCLAGPTVPFKTIGAVSFEIPDHRPHVLSRDLQYDECMRVGEFEFPHDADQLDRVFPIEHRHRMVPYRRSGRRSGPNPHHQGGESRSHGTTFQ